MREYIRHPSDIPIEYELESVVAHQKDYLNNISQGGLSFKCHHYLQEGAVIHIRIPLVHPIFQTDGIVVWCHDMNSHYDVGIKFLDSINTYRIRMVEQICHIEHYKKEVLEHEGRTLSGEEAALEWIRKYAPDFPQLDS